MTNPLIERSTNSGLEINSLSESEQAKRGLLELTFKNGSRLYLRRLIVTFHNCFISKANLSYLNSYFKFQNILVLMNISHSFNFSYDLST